MDNHTKLKIIHLRQHTDTLLNRGKITPKQAGSGKIYPTGGITLAFNPDTMKLGVAICVDKDGYCKKHGRRTAIGRLNHVKDNILYPTTKRGIKLYGYIEDIDDISGIVMTLAQRAGLEIDPVDIESLPYRLRNSSNTK